MVNFKAGGHQGEHKRALAAQGSAVKATEGKVTKEEKRALLQRPWSNDDPLVRSVVNERGLALQVIAREKVIDESNVLLKAALVDAETMAHWFPPSDSGGDSGPPFICRPGGDFVLHAQVHEAASSGEVLLSEAQRLSLHVCEGEVYEWLPFAVQAAEALGEVTIEAQLLEPRPPSSPLTLDASALGLALGKWLFGQLLSINEIFIARYLDTPLVLRVTEITSAAALEAAEAEAAGLEEAYVDEHCFRGLITPMTSIFIAPSSTFKGSDSQRAVADGLILQGYTPRVERKRLNMMQVLTSDGEVFPVHKQLLRPCISLTSAIRSSADGGEHPVPVDCATFDRVLLFLEAASRGRAEDFAFDIATLGDVAKAAQTLGCRQLRECCEKKLGDFESRVRLHRWGDVVRQNERGGCWVTMDGMVFDLEAWLPEHPGGATIIPRQALNKDCAVFFELYHASRESFQYLREFYIGEVWPEDRSLIPLEATAASKEFMQQLQDFCAPFRLSVAEADLPARLHLGMSAA